MVRIPLAIYLAYPTITLPIAGITLAGMNFGVVGAWYAMVADVTLRAALLSWRFFHGGWQHIEV
jgi:Na+-driven multidrug efflux pump